MEWYYILIIVVFAISIIVYFLLSIKREIELRKRINNMINNQNPTSARSFLSDYKSLALKRNGSINSMDTSGVYVLFNKTKNLYYIGQSINVMKRVNNHLSGKGNGDVYADFKYSDDFEITIHNCPRFELNEIERRFIAKYNASGICGYNKNRGNKY